MGWKPERAEKLAFKLTLNQDGVAKHEQAITTLVGHKTPQPDADDELRITYDLHIQYWNVVANLIALQEILSDPDVVVSVSANELKHGTCLIQDVLTELSKVQDQITVRDRHEKALP